VSESTTTTITVVSDPLSVTIGSNDKVVDRSERISPTSGSSWCWWSIASGKAKANVDVDSVDRPRSYWKGFYTRPTVLVQNSNLGGCANEDGNRNGVLEPG
jgi:hypothetical protein